MTFTFGPRLRFLCPTAVLIALVVVAGCRTEAGSTTPTTLPSGTVATAPPSPTPAPTTAVPTTAAPTAAAPTTAAPTTEPPTTSAVTKTPVTAPAHFTTPSGNIGCVLLDGSARCDIQRVSFKKPVDPTCDLEYGDSFAIEPGGQKGRAVCHGDTALGGTKVSTYPARAEQDGTVCDIEEAGVTCKNSGGHGFFVSAESYRLF